MNNNKNQLETLLFKQTYILIITNKDHNKLLQKPSQQLLIRMSQQTFKRC